MRKEGLVQDNQISFVKLIRKTTHVVQLFTTAVDEVRKAKAKELKLPEATRWAVPKAADGGSLTKKQ
ncbi:hypothetical protein DFAR_3740004 [Desulfarculales bacterium]